MLKPKYLERVPENLIMLFSQAEIDILEDMARRISDYDYWIPAAEHQYKKLIELGNFHSFVMEALSARTGKSRKELERLMEEAGAESLQFDTDIYKVHGLDPPPLAASEAQQRTLEAGLHKTVGLFRNLTGTTANTATKQFEDALDRAYMQISTGAFAYDAAIRTAIKDLSRQGVGAICYPSGHIDTLEVAVRRAVITGVNQTALQMQWTLADEMGCDLVEVTAHAGARPEHAVWQGGIYSRSGKSAKYPDFIKITGYGTGPGLGGWNCRHSFFPYFEGMPRTYTPEMLENFEAKDYEYNGQKLTEYEATQRQRYIERQIRRWKREHAAMTAAGQDAYESAAKIKHWQEMQQDFLRQTGLKQQGDREQVPAWGRGEAKAMEHDLAKYEQYRYNKDGTIVVTDDWKSKGKTTIPKSYRPHAVVETQTEYRSGTVQIDRTIYDERGTMVKQIHSGQHNRPKYHQFGMHGEHAHDYQWDEHGKPIDREPHELNDQDRIQHADILGGATDE
ncbi:phage minor capsid protein [Agathobaculum sp. NTUH-O15-33]|uniref:phage minor capsid protein n=1 Tax=Agathobaculum sp. NTUH-O15-33 TaxID=3079302 RepID=UPI002958B7BA|nr:phage minor capsid protein [Agathobaculum sp. NTUH-O15-33]WNX84374.1 phage minor capsid protein [Agathobaculum sp. NTUH-O15-33]